MQRTAPYLVLAAVAAALFLPGLNRVPLIGMDEGLYAECSREMMASGDYIVPAHSGEPFFDKPPLAYWLQAASMKVFGVSALAVRLPSALAMLTLVLLTAYLGERIYGRRAGVLAGLALACCPLTTALARMCLLDALFTLMVTAALGSFLLTYLGMLPRWGYLLACAMAGLSVMAKGPAGAVLIFVTVAAYLLLRRQGREIRRMLLLPGLLLFAAVALPWYVLVQIHTDGAFLREFVIHQNVQRAMGADFSHNMPLYFYIPVYLAGFFPWSVFVLPAFARHVRLRPTDRIGEASLFAAVWTLAIVGVFSLSRSKLPAYILPALPASALLVGAMWSQSENKGLERSLRRCSAVVLVVAAVLAAAMLIGQRYLPRPIPGLDKALTPMGLSLFAGSLAAAALLIRRKGLPAFAALCAGVAGFLIAAVWIGLPIAARTLSDPMVATAGIIRKAAPPGTGLFAYRLSPLQPGISFYAERLVRAKSYPDELARALQSAPTSLVIVQEKGLPDLPEHGVLVAREGPYHIYQYQQSGRALQPREGERGQHE